MCTFYIAFLHRTMYSYRLQHLHQPENSIRHRSNNTFCTRFRKEFHFSIRYGVPLSSLNLLDRCKTQLLLLVKPQQLIQYNLTHIWLVFEKVYEKMKHVNHNIYQNTNTVTLLETNFYKQNRVQFLFCWKNATILQRERFRGSDRLGCWWKRFLLVFLFVQHNGVFN